MHNFLTTAFLFEKNHPSTLGLSMAVAFERHCSDTLNHDITGRRILALTKHHIVQKPNLGLFLFLLYLLRSVQC